MSTPTLNAAPVIAFATDTFVPLVQAVTIAAGTNLLAIGFGFYNGLPADPICTFNGVPVTIAGETVLDGDEARAGLSYLVSPATGTHDLVFQLADLSTSGNIFLVITQWAGVDTTTPFGTWAPITSIGFESRTAWDWDVAAAVGDVILDVASFAGGDLTATPNAGQTVDGVADNYPSWGDFLYAGHKTAALTTENVGYAIDVSALIWGGAIALKGASGGGGAPIGPRLSLLGVGA